MKFNVQETGFLNSLKFMTSTSSIIITPLVPLLSPHRLHPASSGFSLGPEQASACAPSTQESLGPLQAGPPRGQDTHRQRRPLPPRRLTIPGERAKALDFPAPMSLVTPRAQAPLYRGKGLYLVLGELQDMAGGASAWVSPQLPSQDTTYPL